MLFAMVACGESQHEMYENMGEARAAGAVTRGWVPEFVPSTATDIQVFYFIDSPEAWLSAGCSEECVASITRETEPHGGAPPPRPRTSRLSWPPTDAINPDGVQVRRHPSGGLILLDASGRSLHVYHRVPPPDVPDDK